MRALFQRGKIRDHAGGKPYGGSCIVLVAARFIAVMWINQGENRTININSYLYQTLDGEDLIKCIAW